MGQRLGQHFLRDERIVRRILDAAAIRPTDTVLEIGPGRGVLTQPLGEAVPQGRVVAVEADGRLAAALDGRFPHVDVVHKDAMKARFDLLGPFDLVVSNLPYQISGPVTFKLLELLADAPWRAAVLMYQQEFAQRLMASPGSKTYGRLSVQAARWCDVTRVTEVSPAAFDPPPKVRSEVVKLVPKTTPLVVADEALWERLLTLTFSQRRKQLKNTVPTAVGRPDALGVLDGLGMSTLRPEQLSPEDFARLTAALA